MIFNENVVFYTVPGDLFLRGTSETSIMESEIIDFALKKGWYAYNVEIWFNTCHNHWCFGADISPVNKNTNDRP